MRNIILSVTWLLLIATGCFKEDKAVLPYPGEVITIIDSVQVYQSYFDFETGQVVKVNKCNAWQLGFECGPDGWHIITNSGAYWFAYNTGQGDFDAVTDIPASLDNMYDIQHSYPDSTAIGNWVSLIEPAVNYTKNVYLLGKYLAGDFTSIKQIIFYAVNDTSYFFSFKEQGNVMADSVFILKSDSVNFVYFSFDSRQQVNIEPRKSAYDLVFGSYYDLATYFGVTIPYHVGGALLNTWGTEIVNDSITGFNEIGLTDIPSYHFTSRRDIPGYRWKTPTVDITGGGSATYNVKKNYCYIIHTAQDNYFKFRFLSYTLHGSSGFPQFEVKLLE
jgi:hypothetical protein